MNSKPGKFIGIGVGPGDPELLTLKAYRLIQQTQVISYLCNAEGQSQAREIARLALDSATEATKKTIAITMPMSTNRSLANHAYDEAATQIRQQLDAGQNVVFLCEGDPLFFGSFSYLLQRLCQDYTCEVVPGITSVTAASAVLQQPLILQSESFAVISGRHSDEQIELALAQHDSVVIMKAGRARVRILDLLAKTKRTKDARYVEYIGRPNEKQIEDVEQLTRQIGPYFSLFVVLNSTGRAD